MQILWDFCGTSHARGLLVCLLMHVSGALKQKAFLKLVNAHILPGTHMKCADQQVLQVSDLPR
jgi:hypothetical protein